MYSGGSYDRPSYLLGRKVQAAEGRRRGASRDPKGLVPRIERFEVGLGVNLILEQQKRAFWLKCLSFFNIRKYIKKKELLSQKLKRAIPSAATLRSERYQDAFLIEFSRTL